MIHALTLADTRSQACLTKAWSTDSFPSRCTGCSSGSVCFFFISYCTLKFLKACQTAKDRIATIKIPAAVQGRFFFFPSGVTYLIFVGEISFGSLSPKHVSLQLI